MAFPIRLPLTLSTARLGISLAGMLLLASALLSIGCAPKASPAQAPEPSTAEALPESDEVAIEEEAPEVARCHTETQQCDLAEPLPPGAGCFCAGKDGAQEAGTAGG